MIRQSSSSSLVYHSHSSVRVNSPPSFPVSYLLAVVTCVGRNTGWILLMAVRHTGHSSSLLAHSVQQTMWPQGHRVVEISLSMQTRQTKHSWIFCNWLLYSCNMQSEKIIIIMYLHISNNLTICFLLCDKSGEIFPRKPYKYKDQVISP